MSDQQQQPEQPQSPGQPEQPHRPDEDYQRDYRHDHDEKDFAKHDEKDEKDCYKQEEKTAEEKWRRDPVNSTIWAVILIWAGLVFLADNLGMLNNLPLGVLVPGRNFPMRIEAWSLVMIGAGLIMLLGVLARTIIPQHRRAVGGNIILAIIFIAVGLGDLVSWRMVGPLILIGIGVSFLLRATLRTK